MLDLTIIKCQQKVRHFMFATTGRQWGTTHCGDGRQAQSCRRGQLWLWVWQGELKSFTNDVVLVFNNSKNICVVMAMDVEGCEQSFQHCLSQKMSSSLFWQWLQKGGPVNQTICKKMSSCFKNNSGFVLFPSPFLAVKDSFIGDLVTHSLNDSVSDI